MRSKRGGEDKRGKGARRREEKEERRGKERERGECGEGCSGFSALFLFLSISINTWFIALRHPTPTSMAGRMAPAVATVIDSIDRTRDRLQFTWPPQMRLLHLLLLLLESCREHARFQPPKVRNVD